MKTGFLQDSRFLQHDTGYGHPECSGRISTTMRYLKNQPWFASLININANIANLENVLNIHDAAYIKRAEEVCRSGNTYLDSMDVSVCTESYDIALLAAGNSNHDRHNWQSDARM